MRVGHHKEQAMIRSLELSAPLLILRRGSRARNGVNNQLLKCNEDSIKIPLSSKNFWTEHLFVLWRWHTPAPWGQMFLSLASVCSRISLHVAVHVYPLYTKPASVSVLRSSLSHCIKLLNPRGVCGNPDSQPVSQSIGDNLRLASSLWNGGSRVGLSPLPVGSDATPERRCQNWIELWDT